MPEWTLSPGQRIKRTKLHKRFGGQRQSGISPSRKSRNLFIFSDPNSGERHGYYDGWKNDYFHYTGEGQRGNQQMVAGNRAILQAAQDGRAIRVFYGVGGEVEYRGRFALAPKPSWYVSVWPGPIEHVKNSGLHGQIYGSGPRSTSSIS